MRHTVTAILCFLGVVGIIDIGMYNFFGIEFVDFFVDAACK